jgi:hypothetical protein
MAISSFEAAKALMCSVPTRAVKSSIRLLVRDDPLSDVNLQGIPKKLA